MNMRARGFSRERGYRPHGPGRGSAIPRELLQLPSPSPPPNGSSPAPPETPAPQPEGRTAADGVLGPFRLGRLLAQGGSSTVYGATIGSDPQEVALKVLHPSLAGRPGFLDRFESTLVRVTRMRHQGILPILHFGTFEGH